VSHRSLDPEWNALAPFVTLVVELDEGPRLLATLLADDADVAIAQRVALGVESRGPTFVQVHAATLELPPFV
jgi:hypothetical protein